MMWGRGDQFFLVFVYYGVIILCSSWFKYDSSGWCLIKIEHLKPIFVYQWIWVRVRVMTFNATFNNISVISWRSVLLVEETGENHRPAACHWQNCPNFKLSSTAAQYKWQSTKETIYRCKYNISINLHNYFEYLKKK